MGGKFCICKIRQKCIGLAYMQCPSVFWNTLLFRMSDFQIIALCLKLEHSNVYRFVLTLFTAECLLNRTPSMVSASASGIPEAQNPPRDLMHAMKVSYNVVQDLGRQEESVPRRLISPTLRFSQIVSISAKRMLLAYIRDSSLKSTIVLPYF